MPCFDSEILDLLFKLKEEYFAYAIKAEFEDEGISFLDALNLKAFSDRTSLKFEIKTGGAGSIRDLNEAREMGADIIVAPMIESPYAAQKFIQKAKSVFTKEEFLKTEFFINIETITGFNSSNDILNDNVSKSLCGVIFGRNDFSSSINIQDADSDIILNYAFELSKITKIKNKKLIIGGEISAKSYEFLKQLNSISGFETRKVVFKSDIIKSPKLKDAIFSALKFEILWLKNKEQKGMLSLRDTDRIKVLSSRINNNVNIYSAFK